MEGNFGTITCAFCGHGDVQLLGPLLGPIRDNKSDETYHVHHMCALWSPEVWENDQGSLQNVTKEIRRGRTVRCHRCNARGATVGCRVSHCRQTYHFHCAKLEGCTFYPISYQLSCPAHARWFVKDEKQQRKELERKVGVLLSPPPNIGHNPSAAASLPSHVVHPHPQQEIAAQGRGGPSNATAPYLSPNTNNTTTNAQPQITTAAGAGAGIPESVLPPDYYYEGPSPYYLHDHGNAAAAKRRKRTASGVDPNSRLAAATAAMRNLKRQVRMKRLVQSSDDDEEFFAKKEATRLARDSARLNPMILTQQQQHHDDGEETGGVCQLPPPPSGRHTTHHEYQQQPGEGGQVAITPTSITNCDFDSIAGADHVVAQLREMVLLPLLYPDLFQSLGITPPKGILFHGPPGTGKTLAARALAGACSKSSPVPVALFARKGADCLGKFHGEAERTLRLLFEEAKKRAPAIIFLDEIDALAPCRSSRSGGGDQIHASVVSTLLALMDGATDRGGVVVVGATNRPEAIDPALRRPGRFDREVFFPLPGPSQRVAILKALTRKWGEGKPSEQVLEGIGADAEGFAGADLQALCSGAVMAAVRRSAPQLLEQLIDDKEEEEEEEEVFGGGSGDGNTRDMTTSNTNNNNKKNEHMRTYLHSILQGLQVIDNDWKTAMAAAPIPSSRREGLAAVAAASIKPIPPHIWPLVASPFIDMLKFVHHTGLPLPDALDKTAKEAIVVAAAGGGRDRLVAVLEELGAIEKIAPSFTTLHGTDDTSTTRNKAVAVSNDTQDITAGAAGAAAGTTETLALQRNFPPSRLLLLGNGELGQETASGAMLKILEGCQIHTLSLPALLVQGNGDPSAGCAALVGEALRRAGKDVPTVLYLPRIETWALVSSVVEKNDGIVDDNQGDSGINNVGGEKTTTTTTTTTPMPRGNVVGDKKKTRGRMDDNDRGTAGFITSPAQPDNGGGFKVGPSPFRGLVLSLQDRVGTSPTFATTVLSPPPPSSHHHQQQQQHEEEEEEEQDKDVLMEAIQLSEPWLVLETLLRQAPTETPLLVVATCHLNCEDLPECLVSFFSSGCDGGASSISSGIVKFASSQYNEAECDNRRQQWKESMSAAAALVTHQLSFKIALLIYDILTAPAGDGSGNTSATDNNDDVRLHKRQLHKEEEQAAADKANKELEKQVFLGSWLLSQSYAFLKTLGGRLLKDHRCEVATAITRRNKEHSFLDLADDSYRGKYTTIESFQRAVEKLVQNIIATEGVDLTSLGPAVEGVHPAVHAACSLQDDIDDRCLTLRQMLDLVSNDANKKAMVVAHTKIDAEMKKMAVIKREAQEEEEDVAMMMMEAVAGDGVNINTNEDGNDVLIQNEQQNPPPSPAPLPAVANNNNNNNNNNTTSQEEPNVPEEERAAVEVAKQLGALLMPDLEKMTPKQPLKEYPPVQSAEEIVNAMLLHATAVLNEEFAKTNKDVWVGDDGGRGVLVSLKERILAKMATIFFEL